MGLSSVGAVDPTKKAHQAHTQNASHTPHTSHAEHAQGFQSSPQGALKSHATGNLHERE